MAVIIQGFIQPILTIKCGYSKSNYMEKWVKRIIRAGYTSLFKKKLFKIIQDSLSPTWEPGGLSFLQQMGWSLWGKSWQRVEQNFRTCLGTPSAKIQNNLH